MSARSAALAEADPIPAAPSGAIDLENYVPFFLSAVGNRLSRSASRVYLTRFGVGVCEWRLLANLKAQPGSLASEICARSGIDKAAASRALLRLEALGCLASDGKGGKRRPLWLTDAGVALHDRIMVAALHREGRLLHGFTPDERALLLRFLRRLYANLPQDACNAVGPAG